MLDTRSLRLARKERLARSLTKAETGEEKEDNLSESAYRWNPLVQKPVKLGRRPTGGGFHYYGPPPDAGTTYGLYACRACGIGLVAPDKEEAHADKEAEEALFFCPACSTAMDKEDSADSEATATVLAAKGKMLILPACPTCGTVVMTSADVVNKDIDHAYCVKCGADMTDKVRDLQLETIAVAVNTQTKESKPMKTFDVDKEIAAIKAEIEAEKKAAEPKVEPKVETPVAPVAPAVETKAEEEPAPAPAPEEEVKDDEAKSEEDVDKELDELMSEIEEEDEAKSEEEEKKDEDEAKSEDVPPEETEVPPVVEEPKTEAVRYEILNELNDEEEATADSIEMTLWDADGDDPYYNVQINGKPVAQVRLSDMPKSEEIRSAFVTPDYEKALISTMAKAGPKKILTTIGARLFANEINNAKVVLDARAAANETAKNEVIQSLSNLKEEYLRCIGIVAAGMDCNFFRGESHPLKEALWSVMGELGVPESRRVAAIEKAIKMGSKQYHEAILAKAMEYVTMTPQALTEIERAIGEMDTLPPVEDEEDEIKSEDEEEPEEETMAARLTKANAVLANVPGFRTVSKKEKLATRVKFGGASPLKR